MKKVLVLLFGFAVAGQAAAAVADACATGTASLISGNAANFLRVDILPKCSSNVNMRYDQTANGFAVGANSSKGKHNFFGNTGGGAVGPGGVCADATPCTGTKLDTGIGTALAAAT